MLDVQRKLIRRQRPFQNTVPCKRVAPPNESLYVRIVVGKAIIGFEAVSQVHE